MKIPFLDVQGIPSPNEVNIQIDETEAIEISQNPWPEYVNSVKSSYKIAHNGSAIFLKFHVEEDYVLACSTTNGNVHKDSCVEFFVSFQDDESYYNIEFSSLGWGKIGYGTDRVNRTLLNEALVNSISSHTTITSFISGAKKVFKWDITLVLPTSVFCHHNFTSFRTMKAKGNFYKCGENIPEPHFLTWNMVESSKPDFHRKECFAELEFS